MMRLDEMQAIPDAALTLRSDHEHHKMIQEERFIALSQAEYALTFALWNQRKLHYQSGGQQPLALGAAELSRVLESQQPTAQRALSRANVKLIPLGLEIVSLRSRGYVLFRASELVPPLLPSASSDQISDLEPS